MRTIDADALMPLFIKKANTMKDRHGVKLGDEWLLNYNDIKDVIDNAPAVDVKPFANVTFNKDELEQIVKDKVIEPIKNGELVIKKESSRGECKTCKYYHPYYERSEPRGDGYCVIARMTPEGMTTINCSDEFSCSDYQKSERRTPDV